MTCPSLPVSARADRRPEPSRQSTATARCRATFACALLALVALGPGNAAAQTTTPNTFSVLFGGRSETAYEANPLFAQGGPEDISTQLSATSSLLLAVGRGNLSLGGQVDRAFYRRLKTLDRFTYSGDGAAQYGLTSRLALQAAASYATLLISGAGAPDAGGTTPVTAPGGGGIDAPVATVNTIAVPSTIFHTLSLAGAASYTLSERTSAQLSTTFNQVMFDTTGLPDGSTFGGGATLQHRYSERGSVGLAYQYQTNSGVSQAPTVHSALGTWGRSFERFDLGAQLGIVSNATKGEDSWIEPGGGAQLRYRLARGALDFRYNRSAAQAFGLGRILISDEGTVGVSQTLGKYSLNAFATASRGHDTELKSYKLNMYSAGLGVERPIMTTVRLVASLYYRRRSELQTVNDRGARMLVTYNGHYF
jgi:hypothetical protein